MEFLFPFLGWNIDIAEGLDASLRYQSFKTQIRDWSSTYLWPLLQDSGHISAWLTWKIGKRILRSWNFFWRIGQILGKKIDTMILITWKRFVVYNGGALSQSCEDIFYFMVSQRIQLNKISWVRLNICGFSLDVYEWTSSLSSRLSFNA